MEARMIVALSVDLDRETSAPSVARRAIERRFAELDPQRRADLTLVVSELVANAVVHGRGAITLKLEHDGDTVRGEVIDEGGGFEQQVRERGPDEIGGRGLLVVEALATRWGIHEGTTHVWFELSAPPRSTALTEPQLGQAQRPDALGTPQDFD
jgi:anti-sigma regulatory factor (Ser/Thr protein kinase)